MKFQRVLVANRGEIAVRILRSLRQLGLESVAIYAHDDRHSYHVKLADYAVALPESPEAQSPYLHIPTICAAVRASGAQAVHPGYGFLSENSDFAAALEAQDTIFIGPSSKALRQMGDKIEAKTLVRSQGIPTVPGDLCELLDMNQVQAVASNIGFPVILKASAGGGGRGMRVVSEAKDLAAAYETCRREAQSYFGNPAVFCERFIENPRHIEVQVLRDAHGNGVHLFERDCSIQRRNQKLLEEAPSVFLSPEQRMKLGARAVKIAAAVAYCGAGTVEFICESPSKAYFMEMNPRIQVEHPVTEMITGIDLIEAQIRIAQGEPLPFSQADLRVQGHAVEVRINAEDPDLHFIPTSGTVGALQLPGGPFVRTETHLYAGYALPTRYDSMLAKIIAWGPTRQAALTCLLRALQELRIDGVVTTARFHERLLQHPVFQSGDFTTKFLQTYAKDFEKEEWEVGEAAAAAIGVYGHSAM